MGRYKSIQEVKESWRQEPDDNAVFKAATEDIEEYPPEIQAVIKEEAERRRRLNETAEESRKKSRLLKFTWGGVFGFVFFVAAEFMGAPFLISALMLAVGIMVGSAVKAVTEGLKEGKNVGRDNK